MARLDWLRSGWGGVRHHGGHHARQAVVSGHGGLQRGRTSSQYFMWRRGQLTIGSLRLVAALSVKNSCEMRELRAERS